MLHEKRTTFITTFIKLQLITRPPFSHKKEDNNYDHMLNQSNMFRNSNQYMQSKCRLDILNQLHSKIDIISIPSYDTNWRLKPYICIYIIVKFILKQ